MLISAIAYLKELEKEWRNVAAYGQEINQLTSAIGKMNLFFHGVKDFNIVNGDSGAENYPFGKIKIGTRLTTGILVPADDEQYRKYIRSEWNEEKSVERQRRCMVKSPKTGKLIKCTGCCEKCDRMKDGLPLSLDMFYEKTELELPDERQSTRNIDAELLFEQLLSLLEKQAPELAYIFEEMYNGTGQREIERELGIAHGTMTDMVKRMREILQQSVSREDIIG